MNCINGIRKPTPYFQLTFLALIVMAMIGSSQAATFTVTNTADSGAGSLRQAILSANSTPGADTIEFNIPGAGPHTIQPTTALPTVTGPAIIDGYTQPGASQNTLAVGNDAVLLIELVGVTAGNVSGLLLGGSGVTVKGLVINRWGSGILTAAGSAGHTIVGNFVGTDVTGTVDLGNTEGVFLFRANSNRVGGTAPADRNVISGNLRGVHLSDSSTNTIHGNYIGTGAGGTLALGNSGGGVNIASVFAGSHGNLIGGASPGAGNVISGNQVGGVVATGGFDNVIKGNLIGTNASGMAPIANTTGILAGGNPGVFNLLIGGTEPGAGNVISGNTTRGISWADNQGGLMTIQGNRIGVALDGVSPLGNGQVGIHVGFFTGGFFGGGPTLIGGTTAGSGNIIAYNGLDGVRIICCDGRPSPLLGNSIFSNAGLGINLSGVQVDGVTPNDPGDADSGPNGMQNFPVLSSADSAGSNTTILGTLNSLASTTFRVEFFHNDACDPSGHGEGKTYLGSSVVTTDSAGDAAINAVLPVYVNGGTITSTATRLDAAQNPVGTSEFSACVTVVSGPGCATITLGPESLVDGAPGTSYSQTVTADGGEGAYSFSVTDGSLPDGLSLNATTGEISGTPSAAGSFSFTITAADENDCRGSREYSVTIACPLIGVSPSSLPGTLPGSVYFQAISANGGAAPYSFAVTNGSLPAGLTLDPSTGAISGTTTAAGSFTFTVTTTDANGCTGTQTYTIGVSCPPITMVDSLPSPMVGLSYSQRLTVSETSLYTFSLTGGTLPPNFQLNPATGFISGVAIMTGSYTFTITATTGGCTSSRTYTIQIGCDPLSIDASVPSNGTVGDSYLASFAAGSAAETWTITGGALPPGLVLDSSRQRILGVPTAAGTFNFTLTVTAENGCNGSRTFTVVIACPPISLNPATLANGTAFESYFQSLSVSSPGTGYVLSITSGSLPPGLSLQSGNSRILGTPTLVGTYTFTITAANSLGCSMSRTYTIVIACQAMTLSPEQLPGGRYGVQYRGFLSAFPSIIPCKPRRA